jgi:hypothetical protein
LVSATFCCPALHVDLLAERGDRLPELLAGCLDVSPHFVAAESGPGSSFDAVTPPPP